MKFPGDFTVEIIQNGTVPLEIYFSGIILSIISFFLSLIPAHFISLYVSSTYRNGKRRVSWYSYCLSQFHGPTSGFLALYCFWTFNISSPRDWYFTTEELQVVCVLWTLGYMATDLFLLLVFHKEFGFSHFLIFHHILIIATYSLGLLTQPMAGVYFMCAFQVQEITSIFLANRWFLLECEMKESDFYWWNGLFLIISYALIRVLFGSFVLFRLVMNLPEETLQRLDYTVIVFCSVAFQLLQFYFFYKILEVVFKFLGTKKPKKVD